MARSLVRGMQKLRTCGSHCSLTSLRRYSPRVNKSLKSESPTEQGKAEEGSLPLLQRCKNHLHSNWRGQLSTVKADERSIYTSLLQYSVVAGQTLVWISKNDIHESNLLLDNRGSLVIGRTDPPPLIHAIRAVGHVPPCAILLGEFDPVPGYEFMDACRADAIREEKGAQIDVIDQTINRECWTCHSKLFERLRQFFEREIEGA